MDIQVNCPKCGQPITHSNEYGMFCDNECELEESKAADAVLKPWLEAVGKLMGSEEDEDLSPEEWMKKIGDLPESKAVQDHIEEKRR